MPDYGRPHEDLERSLQRSLATYPEPDYGTALLAGILPTGAQPHSAGGRELRGGIMMRPGYKSPIVEIRPSKWTDKFWIRADNYPDAQYIADAVYYYIGKEPFHFPDANFQYPPLRLEHPARELLTREACSKYVESIAKGAVLQKQREDYRERVKELVLKAVKSLDAVLFLGILGTSPEAADASELEVRNDAGDDALGLNEGSHSVDEHGFSEHEFRMDVDEIRDQVDESLPYDVPGMMDLEGGIPTFGIDWSFDSESILRSDWQSLDVGWSHSSEKAKEHTVFSELKDFLSSLDKEEDDLWRPTKSSDWMPPAPSTEPFISHTPLLPALGHYSCHPQIARPYDVPGIGGITPKKRYQILDMFRFTAAATLVV